MRRDERAVTERDQIRAILDACKVFRIAMSVNDVPYLVPLNYGYTHSDGRFSFYFHSADAGKKIGMLKENSSVCFELDTDHRLTTADSPCAYGYNYKSIIGMGTVSFVTDAREKCEGLRILMRHQTGRDFSFSEAQAAAVTVCRLDVSELTAKQRNV